MKTKRASKAQARATPQPRSSARPVPLWIRVFTTVSMVGIVAAAGAGAWIGFQSGGLGVGFAGMLLGGALGYFATYVLGARPRHHRRHRLHPAPAGRLARHQPEMSR